MVVPEIETAIGMEINGPLAWVEFLSKKEKKMHTEAYSI